MVLTIKLWMQQQEFSYNRRGIINKELGIYRKEWERKMKIVFYFVCLVGKNGLIKMIDDSSMDLLII